MTQDTLPRLEAPRLTEKDFKQTELLSWFERERAHMELRCSESDQTILEFWDDAVRETIEAGYLPETGSHRCVHEAMLNLAIERGVYLPVSARMIGENLNLTHAQFKDFQAGIWMVKFRTTGFLPRPQHVAVQELSTVDELLTWLRKVEKDWSCESMSLSHHPDPSGCAEKRGNCAGTPPSDAG